MPTVGLSKSRQKMAYGTLYKAITSIEDLGSFIRKCNEKIQNFNCLQWPEGSHSLQTKHEIQDNLGCIKSVYI